VTSRAVGVVLVVVLGAASTASAAERPKLKVLSNRADLVSGGDALVAITPPPGVPMSQLRLRLGKRAISAASARRRRDGRYELLLTGLINGRNVLVATRPGGEGARLTITNHPQGGPVFSGPQIQPWICQRSAVDSQCNQPARFSYRYKSTDSQKTGLQPYDPANPPSDVAKTTTQTGVTLPFIVRQELGYQDRDQYKIATLIEPGKDWDRFDPPKHFNHKLLIRHGFSCGVDRTAGSAPDNLADEAEVALGYGFATMSTALSHTGHNCNLVTQAESLVMAKEHFVETYGDLRYTIGTGCSGGSLTQQWVANAYPGIYQGITPQCSFPDAWSSGTQVADYDLLRHYFEGSNSIKGLWNPLQWAAVEGHLLPLNAILSVEGYWFVAKPTHACKGVGAHQRYHPQDNIGGIRCGLADYTVNVLGLRPESAWSPSERKLGHSFAGVALDNIGVQYGLESLKRGEITAAQFVDLNTKIGGYDIDATPTPQRGMADQPALANAYRSGLINETTHMDKVAIINLRGPDPAIAHDGYRALSVRARLLREHGTAANHVIWDGPIPVLGELTYPTRAVLAMDRWLARVEKDDSDRSLARKIIANKPADIKDQCTAGIDGLVIPSDGICKLINPIFGTPRTVAGQPMTTDDNKCQLKPMRTEDYPASVFTAAQWEALKKVFPDGVCDWSKPGVSRQPTIAWQTYQDAKGRVIYGGRAMGNPPRAVPCRLNGVRACA